MKTQDESLRIQREIVNMSALLGVLEKRKDIVLDTKQAKAILAKIHKIETENKKCLQKVQYQDLITSYLSHPIKKYTLKRYINRLKQNDDDIQILLQRYCSIVEKFEK